MTRRYVYVHADVFTDRPFAGNQLAVFTDGEGLGTDEMQTIAKEMNFAESTFVLPPEVSGTLRRVRIFTPDRELPLAGHPTIGTAAVLAYREVLRKHGAVTQATLHLNVGPIPVSVEWGDGKRPLIWMTHPPASFTTQIDDRSLVAGALGLTAADVATDLPVQAVSTGAPFLVVPVRDVATLERCRPVEAALRQLAGETQVHGLYVFARQSTDPRFRARMFFPRPVGLGEDPATGAAAGPLGAYLARYGALPGSGTQRVVCEQGVEIGRPSRISIEVSERPDAGIQVRIGGQAVIVAEGELFWD